MKPNPLFVIMALFAVSFVGRTIGMANASIKESNAAVAPGKLDEEDVLAVMPATAEDSTQNAEENAAAAERNDVSSELVAEARSLSSSENAVRNESLLSAIRERSAQLDKRAEEIEDRIRLLEIIEHRIQEKLAELKSNNEELSALVSFANEASQEDILLLAKMYEQMKPQKAAEIFDKMNPTFAAGFLTEMNSENAALILSNMSTDKAYETSMIIASRNAAVYQ